MHWFQFFFSASLIVVAGMRLTRYTDILCEKLRLGKVWVGIVLLGLVTSLPELITSSVAVVSLHAGDLAVGNVLGSNNFNPLLIVVMDLAYRKGSITNTVKPSSTYKFSALIAGFMTLIVMFEIMFSRSINTVIFGPLTYGTFALLICYVAGMIFLSRIGRKSEQPVSDQIKEDVSLNVIWANILGMAVVVTVAAIFLTSSADIIAQTTGWGRTFVGSILLAIVTSLPEMVVTLSAVRLGSVDLAMGNIFGSNIVNMFIVFIFSLLYTPGWVLADVSVVHIGTGLLSLSITAIAVAGIYSQRKKVYFSLGLDSFAMIAVFIIGNYFIYTFG